MTNSLQKPDNRQFTRIPFDSSVRLANSDETWTSQLEDISLKGVLIITPDNWHAKINDQFVLELNLDSSDIQIRMEVTIAHMEGNHVGFRCEHIDLDSITHLRRLVELNLGDTAVLSRELSSLGR